MDFLIHNGSRARHNRNLRAQMAEHGGHKQYVLGNEFRLLRGRPVPVSEDKIKAHMTELLEKEARGLIYVTDLQMNMVDIRTLKVVAEVAPASPAPKPPLDSAANDAASGVPMGQFNEPPPPKEFTMPVDPPMAALKNPDVEVIPETQEEKLVEEPTLAEKPVKQQHHNQGRRGGR